MPNVHAAVYTDEDPPVQNDIVGLAGMCAKMPMRSTRGSLPSSRASQSKGGNLDEASPTTKQTRETCYNNNMATTNT